MGADFTLKPFKAGTGPFILSEAVKNDHYTLDKNPDWWGKDAAGNKLPFLDKIIVKPILDARRAPHQPAHGQRADPEQHHRQGRAGGQGRLVTHVPRGRVIRWNSMIPNETAGFLFNEKRYVKAVAMAIDRDEILAKGPAQGVGLVGWGPISPAHFAWDADFKPWPKADIDGAKKLVTEVGKGPLKFELLVSSGDAAILQLAQLIQAQLAKADITAEIKTQLFNDIVTLQQAKKHLGMTLIGWSGRLDPDGNTYDFVVTGSTEQRLGVLQREGRRAHEGAARRVRPRQAQDDAARGAEDLRPRRPVPRLVRLRRLAAHHRQEADRNGVLPGPHPAVPGRTAEEVRPSESECRAEATE